jgi:putative sigma-54 modulation protein
MQHTVTFRHMEPIQSLKDYGVDKISKLEKYLDSVLDAEITFTSEKFRHRTAVVLSSNGLKIKAEHESEDMYSSVDLVVDKLEKQLKRHREKLRQHKGGGAAGLRDFPQDEPSGGNGRDALGDGDGRADGYDVDAGPAPSKTLDLPLARMSQEEAVSRLSTSALPFFVYLDEEDGGTRLLRHSGSGSLELVRFHRQAD